MGLPGSGLVMFKFRFALTGLCLRIWCSRIQGTRVSIKEVVLYVISWRHMSSFICWQKLGVSCLPLRLENTLLCFDDFEPWWVNSVVQECRTSEEVVGNARALCHSNQ